MPPSKTVIAALNNAGADAVRDRVEAVLSEPLYWFPVRASLAGRRPARRNGHLATQAAVLFIEGP